jgi:hypothetical protein
MEGRQIERLARRHLLPVLPEFAVRRRSCTGDRSVTCCTRFPSRRRPLRAAASSSRRSSSRSSFPSTTCGSRLAIVSAKPVALSGGAPAAVRASADARCPSFCAGAAAPRPTAARAAGSGAARSAAKPTAAVAASATATALTRDPGLSSCDRFRACISATPADTPSNSR